MAILHCDYLNGDDTTGTGSSAAPYKTLTKAFSVLTNADSIKIANTAAQQESNLAFPAVTFTIDDPLIIEGWDNGGSLVIESPLGDIAECGVIDNSGTTNPLFSNAITDVKFINIQFNNFATNFWSTNKTRVNYFQCVLNNVNQIGQITDGLYYGCSIIGGANNPVSFGTRTSVFFCYFNFIYATLAASCIAFGCIFDRVSSGTGLGSALLVTGGDFVKAINCTFIGRNLNSAITDQGVTVNATSIEEAVVTNCHFQNFTGAGAVAVSSSPTTKGSFAISGANSFFNVTTKYAANALVAVTVNLQALDITESSDPLEDVANLDFRKKSTALSLNSGFIGYLKTETPAQYTTGGPQNLGGSGGGGDTESSYAGV
jgi:hypothetical protein